MKRLRTSIMLLLLALCVAMGVAVAGCGKGKVTITFEMNGANEKFEPMKAVAGEDMIIKIPTRDGYEFTGWYDNEALQGTAIMGGTVKAPEQDTTYYAGWAQLYKVTLDSAGGSFSDGNPTKDVMVAKGAGILNSIKEYVPYKGEMEFGAWYFGDEEVSEETKMPGRELILTAKYKVGYYVEVYKQVSSSKGYEHDESADFEGSAFCGQSFTVTAPEIEGYDYFRNHMESIHTLLLDEDPDKNQFRIYYNKHAYTIIYDANAPIGTTVSGYTPDQKILFGETGNAQENGYSIRSYRFAGWSRSASGQQVEFQPGQELPATGDLVLYAIWDAGYSDTFGGTDCIFFPHTGRDGTAILQRGNAEIKGVTKKLNGTQYEDDQNGMYVDFGNNLIAKLIADKMTFSFLDEDLSGDYSYYDPYYLPKDQQATKTATLNLDGYDIAKLTEGDKATEYTYGVDEATGRYKLTDSKGTVTLIELGKQGEKKVFTYLGTEIGTFPQYERITVRGNYAPGNHQLVLDGFGNAVWQDMTTNSVLKGRYERPEVKEYFLFAKIHLDNGELLETVFLPFNETTTAVCVSDGYAGEYNFSPASGKSESGKLVLDGFFGQKGEASYEVGNQKNPKIEYMVENTVMGTVVNIIESSKVTHRYGLDATNHTFSELDDDYSVYQHLYAVEGGNTVDEYYLIVFNKETDGKRNGRLMQIKDDKSETVYEGTVTADAAHAPLQHFKANGNDKKSFATEFSFYTTDRFTLGNLFYIYLENDDPSTTETNEKNFRMIDGTDGRKILFYEGLNASSYSGLEGVGSFITETNGTCTEGSFEPLMTEDVSKAAIKSYFKVEQFYSFAYYFGDATMYRYYALTKEGEKETLELLQDQPMALMESYSIMPEKVENPFSQEYSLYFDGNGHARYMTRTASGEVFVEGTYQSMGLVNNKYQGYSITLTDDNYQDVKGNQVELVISGLSPMLYCVHNQLMEGNNEIEEGGYVWLDGWGTEAHYVDNWGNEYEGYYSFYYGMSKVLIYESLTRGVVQVQIRDGKFVNTPVEITREFYVVDQNYKSIIETDAAAIFDGEGGVTIEDMRSYKNWQINGGDSNPYGYKRVIYGKGNYEVLAEDVIYLNVGIYGENNKITSTRTWTAKLNGDCCVELNESSVGSYIQDSDKAVLYFDGYGTGFYIDGRGNREDGSYVFVENDKVVFMNDEVVYFSSVKTEENGTRSFKILSNPEKFKTFYADDLSSIEYGYSLRVDGLDVGVWYLDESDKFFFYEMTDNGFEKSTAYTYPTGDTYDVKLTGSETTKRYTLWKSEDPQTYTLTGDIIFRAMEERGESNSSIKNAKLTFTPDGSPEINATATLEFTDFVGDANKQKKYENLYTVKRVRKDVNFMDAVYGSGIQTTTHLFLCYGDMEFALIVDKSNNSFKVWANIDYDTVGTDLSYRMGLSSIPNADIGLGRGYTLGLPKWSLTNWIQEPKENDILLGGCVKALDANGDLIYFEVIWSDYVGKQEKIVGRTTETGVSGELDVYEIFTKNMDGKTESIVMLESFSAGAAYYFNLYAVCDPYEVKVTLPNNQSANGYKVIANRTIFTTKNFASCGNIAYLHVYKQDSSNSADTTLDGYKDISAGYAMYIISADLVLVEGKDPKPGKKVISFTPKHLGPDQWDFGNLTMWFGIDKEIEPANEEMKADDRFKNISFEVLLLSDSYVDGLESTVEVKSGWLIFEYLKEGDEKTSQKFLYGYANDGVTRINRVTALDKIKKFDLTFGGTIKEPTITFKQYSDSKS